MGTLAYEIGFKSALHRVQGLELCTHTTGWLVVRQCQQGCHHYTGLRDTIEIGL